MLHVGFNRWRLSGFPLGFSEETVNKILLRIYYANSGCDPYPGPGWWTDIARGFTCTDMVFRIKIDLRLACNGYIMASEYPDSPKAQHAAHPMNVVL